MRNKIVIIVLAAIILLGAGTFVGLFATGKLVWGSPNAKQIDKYVAVCDESVIAKYNDAMLYTKRNGSNTASLDTGVLNSLKASIPRLSGSKEDPTCQSILFWIAVIEENYDNAKAAYDNVKRLYEEGLFANSNLNSNQPLSSYEGAMYSFSPAGKESKVKLGDD